MTTDETGPACVDHIGLYDQIIELGAETPVLVLTHARGICDGCPVSRGCHSGAVDRGEQWGMWGGVLMAGDDAEPTLDQSLGIRTGFEIGDLVEVIDSDELADRPGMRHAAMVRLHEEVEVDSRRPGYLLHPNYHRSDPVSYARRHRGVPERIWVAAMRAGIGARNAEPSGSLAAVP